jgi:hypothetical protein
MYCALFSAQRMEQFAIPPAQFSMRVARDHFFLESSPALR